MSNYDRALQLHIHNSEVANNTVNTFLVAESVILGFLSNGFFERQNLEHSWLLFGGSVFGLLLVIPWWGSYSYRLAFHKLRIEQAKRYEKDNAEDKDASVGKLLTEGENLKKDGGISINGKVIYMWCDVMRVRTAYRFLMIMFAVAFMLMAVTSFLNK